MRGGKKTTKSSVSDCYSDYYSLGGNYNVIRIVSKIY